MYNEEELTNQIFNDDNLEILKNIPKNIFDLIYIDPPFFSQENYKEFKDIWVSLNSYLEFMKLRIGEIYRVLKKTGSFYLHCDYHAVHYLKKICDDIFGYKNFINEIIWYYDNKYAVGNRRCSRSHDTILFYVKNSESYIFNPITVKAKKHTLKRYNKIDEEGRRYYQRHDGRRSYYKNGKRISSDVWIFAYLNSASKDRTSYPTQKPEILLERIIKASTNEGDLVGDFFCGSGTTLVVSKKNNRRWCGVDTNAEAVKISKERLNSPNIIKIITEQKQKRMF